MLKRCTALVLVLIFAISLLLTACETSHECDFCLAVEEECFLRSSATCLERATYYYSCECGAVGEEYFTSEAALSEHYLCESTDVQYLKFDATCQSGAEYYYSCAVCGEASDESFFAEEIGVCMFDNEVVAPQYLKSAATEASAAIYYKSCRGCGKAGNETFFHGDPLGVPPKEPDPDNLPRSFVTQLTSFRTDLYEIRWTTKDRPTKPMLRISLADGEWKEYGASISKLANNLGYLMRVRVRLDGNQTYLYQAYDPTLEVYSDELMLRTKDTDTMAQFYLMGTTSDVNMFGAVVLTKHKTIVFDGGRTEADGHQLAELLNTKADSRVDAWFFTHPHSDHISAFYFVVTQHSEIEIGKVYYNVPTLEAMAQYGRGGNETNMWKNVLNLFDQRFEGRLHVTATNETFTFDGVQVKVLRVYNPSLTKGDFTNEASSVYRVENERASFLILGDIGPYAAEEIMANCSYADLTVDYVQMAHHGQGGASKAFYDYIKVKRCLWPTNVSLWNNDNGGGFDTGPWSTVRTREWMAALGVTEHYIAKDGTQTIDF